MSFMDKVGSLMRRPGEDVVPKDEIPMWMKYAGRGFGTFAGGLAIFFGLWNCISILLGNVEALLSGMFQMVAGFVVIVIESPCCCFFIDFVHTFSEWADKKPFWQRAGFYIAIAVPPVLFYFSVGTFLGCGLIFATGVGYGMMALGKKATLEDMRAQASQADGVTKSKTNLVESASPISKGSYVPPV